MDRYIIIAFALILAVCGAIDARKYIIPNLITIPVIILGLAYQVYHKGYINLALAAAVAAIAIIVALLTKGGLGGGDLKLLTGLALWLKLPQFLHVVLISSFIGIAWGLVRKIRARGYKKVKEEYLGKMLFTYALGLRNGLAVTIDEEHKNNDIVAYGTCIAIGYLLYFLLFPAAIK